MSRSSNKLNMQAIEKAMSVYGIQTVYYVDRLHIYFDALTSFQDVEPVLSWHKDNWYACQNLPHHPQFNKKVELYQVTQDQLVQLQEMVNVGVIGGEYLIHYVELAVDFRTQYLDQLKKLRIFFDKHLALLPYRKSKDNTLFFNSDHETSYFSKAGASRNMKMYCDTTYRKDSTKYSLHIEHIASGMNPIKKLNCYLFEDIITFDHEGFWSDYLSFFKPNYTKAADHKTLFKKRNMTRQGRIKAGKKYWTKLKVLQKLFSFNSRFILMFTKMTTASIFQKFLGEALK